MASTAARSQFYKNTLQPIPITELSLKSCLKDLQTAIEKGVDIIASQPSKQTNDDGIDFGHIFSGELGKVHGRTNMNLLKRKLNLV